MTVATLTEHRPAVALFGPLVRRLCWPPIGDPSLSLDGALSLDAMESRILGEALRRNGDNVRLATHLVGRTRENLRFGVTRHRLKTSD